MTRSFRSLVVALAAACAVAGALPASAQFVVTDPSAEVSLISQIGNSAQQLRNDVTKLANQATNLTCLASYQAWVDVSKRLVNLESMTTQASHTKNAYINAVLNKQMGNLQSELGEIQTIQNAVNSAKGNCANQQAQARAQQALLSEMQEARQLQQAALLQAQQDQADAMKRIHARATDPTKWR